VIVVSDTSPLSNLEQIGRLRLLRDLYGQVVIPPAVEIEIRRRPEDHPAFDWSIVRVIRPANMSPVAEAVDDLDRGESEAIALAVELEADLLLIDEFAGREAARRLGLSVTGLLGVLLEAKRRGLVRSMRDEIDLLVNRTTFRISGAVRAEVLRRAGED
jgi:predicted nucleic acid-binding protein